jgi:hypothetical protein
MCPFLPFPFWPLYIWPSTYGFWLLLWYLQALLKARCMICPLQRVTFQQWNLKSDSCHGNFMLLARRDNLHRSLINNSLLAVCYASINFFMLMRMSLVGLIATRKKVGVMVTVEIVCLTTGQLRMSTANKLLFIRDRCKLSLRARSMKFPWHDRNILVFIIVHDFRVDRSLVFYVGFCRSLCVLFCHFLFGHCISDLRLTASDYNGSATHVHC